MCTLTCLAVARTARTAVAHVLSVVHLLPVVPDPGPAHSVACQLAFGKLEFGGEL